MNTLIIPATVRSVEDVHATVAAWEGVPAHYGRNLDALADVLGALPRAVIVVEDAAALTHRVREFATLWTVLVDAAVSNPGLALVWGAASPSQPGSIGA